MRRQLVLWTLLVIAALPGRVIAQFTGTGQIPNFGAPVTGPNQDTPPPDDVSPLGKSYVSIIDSAVPVNTLRLRLDLGYDMPRPTRAEYFQAKPGVLLGPGMILAEPKIQSYQDLAIYGEFAPVPFFSTFIETPMRWLNPEVNANTYGIGDINLGFKLAMWNSADFLASLQLRFFDPTAQGAGLGTHHWTADPALLLMWRPYDNIILEGDIHYWAPLGGTDFAGDILRYGVGISLGSQDSGFWFKPVVEVVGWSVLGGKQLVATTADSFMVQNASGATIVNGYAGLRFGFGPAFDCYAGYGRCFTGSIWTRDFARVEVRWFW
jgi:hypothetical protein